MTADEIRQEDDRLITEDVARAVEEQELVAYYQPVFDLAAQKVMGAESLVRWTMKDGTVVPAGLFVPSLDRTDAIYGLDWFMAEEVCGFLANAKGTDKCVPISLNFSTRHAADEQFAQKLCATADWHNVDHGLVCLEVSEKDILAMDPAVIRWVESVMQAGFVVMVDNVATGADGLREGASHGIRHFKLSRAYWLEASQEELAACAKAAEELGVALSAEGVEHAPEVERLLAGGIKGGQGYHLATPMDAQAFMAL